MTGQTDLKEFILQDIEHFTRLGSQLTLRSYQREAAGLICRSVILEMGLSFVVMFPRQSGKNELQAQIEAYLLALLSQREAEIVKVSPTYKPQTLNAMRRLQRVLEKNLLTAGLWNKESGYIFRLDQARVVFLSGSPKANIVGATASTLLEVDEAQDVEIVKFDKDIAPMAASTNATRVFWGTAWTSRTLLARELRASREAEKRDGCRRVFVLSAPDVAAEVPVYGDFVAEQVAKLGRNNPMVRTQFFSEEIDAEGGMFPPARTALMYGSHPGLYGPSARGIYCILIDVAGEDEGISKDTGELFNPGRDSTALTVVEVLLPMGSEKDLAPTYNVVFRKTWIGLKQTSLYSQIKATAELWRCRWLVIDATGVGAGLASFLDRALPGKVLPFVFNSKTKSELGWDFLSVIDTGRWKEYAIPAPTGTLRSGDSGRSLADLNCHQQEFFNQLAFCQYEIIPGPEKKMRWAVPEGQRDPATGELVHDDLILSAALVAVLDSQQWGSAGPALMVQAADPLKSMDKERF